MKTTTTLRILLAGLCAAGLPSAHAFDLRPDGVSVQGGAGGKGTTMAGVGIVWEWDFQRMRRKAELTAHTELMLNHWNYHALGGGGEGLTQVALLPSLRMRLDRGQSRWFIELGIGVSWMDQTFMSERKTFSTRWNFYDMMGIGHSFGAEHEHEVALRWVHVSNGGLKEPNPGQDFLQLRYVSRF
jgi:lipid A 3-O-deacylase